MTDSLKERLDEIYRAGGDQALLDRICDERASACERDLWTGGDPCTLVLARLTERHVADGNTPILKRQTKL